MSENLFGPAPVTIPEMVKEQRREIDMRQHVYRNQVLNKKMSQALADRRVAILEAIIKEIDT